MGGGGGGEGNPSLYTKIGPPLISYIHLSIEIQMEKLISPKIWKFSKLMRPCTANSVLVIFQRCQVTSKPLSQGWRTAVLSKRGAACLPKTKKINDLS